MPTSSLRFPVFLIFIAVAAPAFAQHNDPRFALVASFPSPTVSVQWEASKRFAIRFDGSYSRRDETTERTTGSSSYTDFTTGATIRREQTTESDLTSSSSSLGVTGIYTLRQTDRIRLYLAPRVLVTFARQDVTETTTTSGNTPTVLGPGTTVIFGLPTAGPETTRYESNTTSPGAGLSLGASSKVHDRLALFGEAGVTWSRSNSPLVIPTSLSALQESKRTLISTRAVAGIMFLF